MNDVEEVPELDGSMSRVTPANDVTHFGIKSGNQRRGAMTNVLVPGSFFLSGEHREGRTAAIQRLNLGLLVHAQHQRAVWWHQVQPHHVADLLNQQRVGGELERRDQVGP